MQRIKPAYNFISFHFLTDVGSAIVSILLIVLMLLSIIHVVMNKRDPRSAVGWIGIIFFMPIAGIPLYLIFGINRIQRKARRIRKRPHLIIEEERRSQSNLFRHLLRRNNHLSTLETVNSRITTLPLTTGNRITPLFNGEEAYPAMLEAITSARSSITLATYILEFDVVGELFCNALADAKKRGVDVRVLLDYLGCKSYFNNIGKHLVALDITTHHFLPTYVPRFTSYVNLRNHRKLLVIDGQTGFTGGMNIGQNYCLTQPSEDPTRDIHFKLEGPIVAHLQDTFVEDWYFTTNEMLRGSRWFPTILPVGPSAARGIRMGPDLNLEKLKLVIMSALASARKRVLIQTPYFLPDITLNSCLIMTALRNVEIDIVLPLKSDLTLVDMAMRAQIKPLLDAGCRVWLTPPPFDHSKLMLVDDTWTLFGSANWDPRSLRLNFEFNVEVYDAHLAQTLTHHIREQMTKAIPLTALDINTQPYWTRFKNNVIWLFSPYL